MENLQLNAITRLVENISPTMFCDQLIKLASKTNKCIILPEGEEYRIIKAASICEKNGIAHCILIGNLDKIYKIANEKNICIEKNIEIIDPKNISKINIKKYISRLFELRKNKGMTMFLAEEQIKDNVVLGTLMLEEGEVNGLVSGAINTTANTVRTALQIIKTKNKVSFVSSIFFMLFPKHILIYGDCAINPNPSIEQLSEIAIQSAQTAINFGIEPRIAMISYSTLDSGKGKDVDKVYEATILVKKRYPNLLIDGPLQYDAAISTEVAKIKAPNSLVAGKANIIIFPDLNTGNTTYKAVQRSTGIVSIGPILQGLSKPVNDLSRGASLDDIIYTIAVTSVQAT